MQAATGLTMLQHSQTPLGTALESQLPQPRPTILSPPSPPSMRHIRSQAGQARGGSAMRSPPSSRTACQHALQLLQPRSLPAPARGPCASLTASQRLLSPPLPGTPIMVCLPVQVPALWAAAPDLPLTSTSPTDPTTARPADRPAQASAGSASALPAAHACHPSHLSQQAFFPKPACTPCRLLSLQRMGRDLLTPGPGAAAGTLSQGMRLRSAQMPPTPRTGRQTRGWGLWALPQPRPCDPTRPCSTTPPCSGPRAGSTWWTDSPPLASPRMAAPPPALYSRRLCCPSPCLQPAGSWTQFPAARCLRALAMLLRQQPVVTLQAWTGWSQSGASQPRCAHVTYLPALPIGPLIAVIHLAGLAPAVHAGV